MQSKKVLKFFQLFIIHYLTQLRNFSSLYYDRAAKYCIQWLLPLTNLQFIKNTLLKLYRRKYKEHYTELCSKSDKVVLLSEKYVSDLKFFVGDKYTEKIIWIPNPTSFNVSDSELLTIEKKKKAIFVGTIDFTYKRVDLLLEIWQKTSKKHPECQLMIVGGGNGLKKAKDLSQKLSLKNVTFEGFQNPKKYYEDASIFCMTSSCEGFGIVLIEAMQYGVVPIAFDSYVSARDIIDSKINGVLVKPFDLEKYVDELCKLIEDNEYLTRLSKEALTKSKEFSAKKIGDIWLNNFAMMLGESV